MKPNTRIIEPTNTIIYRNIYPFNNPLNPWWMSTEIVYGYIFCLTIDGKTLKYPLTHNVREICMNQNKDNWRMRSTKSLRVTKLDGSIRQVSELGVRGKKQKR